MTAKSLKQLRTAKGLTQAELAAKLGVHIITVAKWETGVHRIPASVALVLPHIPGKKSNVRRQR